MVRDVPHYRRDAILEGLRAADFQIVPNIRDPRPGDAVVVWNRYSHYETEAQRFERAGAAVLVVENGYLGHHYNDYAKAYTADGEQLYSLALNNHNGAGQWWTGGRTRWRCQGIELKPWRETGEHVLVLAARGIGPVGVAQPRDWPQRAVERLRVMTKRPVRLRAHPGNKPAKKPLEADLEDAWCAVTWGSGAALKAICAGVPVFYDFTRWIGRHCADTLNRGVETPLRSEELREYMLDRLAWAQHRVSEIATGEPFRRLMEVYEQRAKAA